MAAPTLYYFPAAGRGELTRTIAAAGGIELIEGGVPGAGVDKSDYGSPSGIPLLSHGALKMSQSTAIENYMSLLAFPDLAPQQRAVDSQFCSIKEDVAVGCYKVLFNPQMKEDKAKGAEELKKNAAKWYPIIEKRCPHAGFINGEAYPTAADVAVLNICDAVMAFDISNKWAGVDWAAYPKMRALANRTAEYPSLKAYLAKPGCTFKADPMGLLAVVSKASATPESLIVKPEFVGQCDVAIIGLGTMGYNLAINILDKGFTLAVFNSLRNCQKTEEFLATHRPKYGDSKVFGAKTYEDLAKLLKKPRKALILVVAGPVTNAVIDDLSKVFDNNDIIVDTGNAHFKDQSGRAEALEAKGLRFLGMGISGGAEGARKGPAFFPGGTLSIWDEIKHIVEAASAKASDGRPCVTMCGKGGAGSCVKMYHNAGEYAVLQIWGEVVVAMRNQGLNNEQIKEKLLSWKARKDLDSYMLDITIEVAGHKSDEASSGYLMDVVGDAIGSKGTGLWSVQVAMEVGCPCPSLAAAVVARQTSMEHGQRQKNTKLLGQHTQKPFSGAPAVDNDKFCEDLYWAAYLSIVASYAQMFESLRAIERDYQLEMLDKLPRIISTFRAGCILQGAMLEPMTVAFEKDPNIPNLMCAFAPQMEAGMSGFRATCFRTALVGEPLPVISASLGYVVQMTQTVINAAQVVSLQRDVFGRHGFKKLKDGVITEETFNNEWPEMQ